MVEPGKDCFKCGRHFPLSEYYRHPGMGDGRLGKCKECTKQDVHQNYLLRVDQYKAYERERNRKPERRVATVERQRRRRVTEAEKYKARQAVSNALRNGKLKRLPCEVCGNKDVEAHHEDYAKPLDVKWLCFLHHRQAHGQLNYLPSNN